MTHKFIKIQRPTYLNVWEFKRIYPEVWEKHGEQIIDSINKNGYYQLGAIKLIY